MVVSVSLLDIARLRVVNSGLAAATAVAAPPPSPVGVVRRVLAMQAQDQAGALWSIGIRSPGSTVADVTGMLASGLLVRSWPMRGTLHITAAEDLPWLLDLCGPRAIAGAASRRRELGVSEDVVSRGRDVLSTALAGGRALSRPGAFALLDRNGIPTSGQRGIHLLGLLCQLRVLCLGPMDGRQPTFVLFDEWIPAQPTIEREQALRDLAVRFFRGHGPATAHDLARWSNLGVTDARRGAAAAADALEKVENDGTEYWQAADSPGPTAVAVRAVASTTHPLAGFDELIVGYRDRGAVLDAQWSGRVVPGGNGVFQPAIVDGGRVVGTWRRARKSGGTAVTPTAFEPVSAGTTRRLERAFAGYGKFLGEPVRMEPWA
jgi:hypothetical protein